MYTAGDAHENAPADSVGRGVFHGLGDKHHRLVSRDRGKCVEKALDRISFFQIVHQCSNRDAGSDEDRFTAHDLGIRFHDGDVMHLSLLSLLVPQPIDPLGWLCPGLVMDLPHEIDQT